MNISSMKGCYVLFGCLLVICSLLCILSLLYFPTGYWFDPMLCILYVFIMYCGISFIHKALKGRD